MNKIKILVVEPNKEPYQLEVENKPETLQMLVDGLIDFIELEYNVDLIINDEGKIQGLPLNRIISNDVIAGTFLVVGQHKGKTTSLTEKQIDKYKKIFELSEHQKYVKYLEYNISNDSFWRDVERQGLEKTIKLGLKHKNMNEL